MAETNHLNHVFTDFGGVTLGPVFMAASMRQWLKASSLGVGSRLYLAPTPHPLVCQVIFTVFLCGAAILKQIIP